MRTRILPILSILVFLACTRKDNVTPTGPVIKDNRPVSDFTAIDIRDGMRTIIRIDTFDEVVVETNQNLQQFVETKKQGSTLIVEIDNSVNFPPGTIVNIYITAQILLGIEASGGSDLLCLDTLNVKSLNMDLSGGSQYEGDVVVRNTFTVEQSGGSLLSLSGSVENYNLTSSGGSITEGFTLTTNRFTCDISGGGIVTMTITGNLSVTASGGSSINYRGGGSVGTSNLSGGSVINWLP